GVRGKVAGLVVGFVPPWLNPHIVWGGILGSEVIRKFVFCRIRSMKNFCGGNWLKNWKQSVPGLSTPLNWPRPSKGSPFAGLMALLGQTVGAMANPGSLSCRSGRTGEMVRGSTKGVVGGLQPS